jgi:hypothetical protein
MHHVMVPKNPSLSCPGDEKYYQPRVSSLASLALGSVSGHGRSSPIASDSVAFGSSFGTSEPIC